MSKKTTAEVSNEIVELQKDLKQLLEVEGSLIYVDLDYFADTLRDLKQELRLAKARE